MVDRRNAASDWTEDRARRWVAELHDGESAAGLVWVGDDAMDSGGQGTI